MQAARGGACFLIACINQACNAREIADRWVAHDCWPKPCIPMLQQPPQVGRLHYQSRCILTAPFAYALQSLCALQAGESEEDSRLPVLESVQCLAAAWQGAGLATVASRGNDLAHALAQPMSPGKYSTR